MRDAVLADAADLALLHRLCLPGPWPLETFQRHLQDGCHITLIAEIDGQPVGYLAAQTLVDDADLLNLAVLADRRRQGIGQILLDSLLVRLEGLGFQRLFLEVAEKNLAARRLYESRGFTQISRRRGYEPLTGDDALVLIRDLCSIC